MSAKILMTIAILGIMFGFIFAGHGGNRGASFSLTPFNKVFAPSMGMFSSDIHISRMRTVRISSPFPVATYRFRAAFLDP